MKYSFMSFSTPSATLREIAAIATRYGYDGIEPRIGADHSHGIELEMSRGDRSQARTIVGDAGIELACIATSLQFADPAAERETFESALQAIDLAADLGCPVLRVFGGSFPDNMTREDAVARCVEAFRRVEPHASERKVTLAFETHDAWTDPKHVMQVVNEVGSDAIAVNWDVMHPVRMSGYSMDESYKVVAPAIRHVHVHDGDGPGADLKIRPMGSGHYDHKTVIRLLQQAGYDGYISGEWIVSILPEDYGYEKHLPHEIETLRSYEA